MTMRCDECLVPGSGLKEHAIHTPLYRMQYVPILPGSGMQREVIKVINLSRNAICCSCQKGKAQDPMLLICGKSFLPKITTLLFAKHMLKEGVMGVPYHMAPHLAYVFLQ